jgi:predicted transcriptional regulator
MAEEDIPVTIVLHLSDVQVGVALLQAVMFGIYDAREKVVGDSQRDEMLDEVTAMRLEEVEAQLRGYGYHSPTMDPRMRD